MTMSLKSILLFVCFYYGLIVAVFCLFVYYVGYLLLLAYVCSFIMIAEFNGIIVL